MRRLLASILERMLDWVNKRPHQQEDLEKLPIEEPLAFVHETPAPEVSKKQGKAIQKKKTEVINYPDIPIRDVIDLMEIPFVSLSKDRINPIIFESTDKTQKVVISGHRGHFLASIYDWDIILVVAGKIQEILNSGSDIPSHKITIPRHELLKALGKNGGRKQQKDLEKSLKRLQLTGIETTVNNKDFRHKAGFGFIDSWGYTERKNDRETRVIQITLSPWLYEICCSQGALLKPNRLYFDIKSGLQKFLYRTARKHAGEDSWEFSVEKLYEKSGSERDFRKFKAQLKKAVLDDDIPEYFLTWVVRNRKNFVLFKNKNKVKTIEGASEEFEEFEKQNEIKTLDTKINE